MNDKIGFTPNKPLILSFDGQEFPLTLNNKVNMSTFSYHFTLDNNIGCLNIYKGNNAKTFYLQNINGMPDLTENRFQATNFSIGNNLHAINNMQSPIITTTVTPTAKYVYPPTNYYNTPPPTLVNCTNTNSYQTAALFFAIVSLILFLLLIFVIVVKKK